MTEDSGKRSAERPSGTDADRLEHLSLAVMDRLLSAVRASSPDAHLSYARYRLLARIEEGAPIGVGELAAATGIARSTASETVARLVAEGLVAKVSAPSDGRSVAIVLTGVGRRLVQRRRKDLREAYRRMVSRMPPHDAQALLEAFTTIERLTRSLGRAKSP